jgi:hypothetical protein
LDRQVESRHHCKIARSGETSASVLRQVPCRFEDDLENYVPPQSSSSNAIGFNIKLQECQKSSRAGSLRASCRSRISFRFRAIPTSFLDLEAIAQADGNISQYFSAVKTRASILVDRLENNTKVDGTLGIPHE